MVLALADRGHGQNAGRSRLLDVVKGGPEGIIAQARAGGWKANRCRSVGAWVCTVSHGGANLGGEEALSIVRLFSAWIALRTRLKTAATFFGLRSVRWPSALLHNFPPGPSGYKIIGPQKLQNHLEMPFSDC